jgi:uncharacterized protein involved in outer membrane biogenesis
MSTIATMQASSTDAKWSRVLPRSRAACLVLGLLAVLVLAAASQPWWLAPLLTGPLEKSSGRSVHFDSIRIGLTSALDPVLHFRGARIDNAAWADAGKPFAALGEASAVVSWRSFTEGRAVILLMTLRDGYADLELAADGRRNWRLRDPENRGPGRYKVERLLAQNATVRFRNAAIDLVLEATASPNTTDTSAVAMPTRIELAGQWRKVPFEASVASGAVVSFVDTDGTFPLRGHVTAGGSRLDIDGRAGDIFREPRFDARVLLVGDSLAPFQAFVGGPHEGRRAFRVEGHLQADGQGLTLMASTARVGATDLAGDLAFGHHGDRRHLRATLRSVKADAADLRWLVGTRVPAAAAASSASAASAASAAAAPMPAAGPAFDADVDYAVASLRVAEAPWLRSLSFQAALADGRLRVGKFDLGVLQGRASGRVEIDLRKRPISGEGDLTLRDVRVESLMPAQPAMKRVSGLLHAQAHMQASGDSARALLASATGRIDASLTRGTISSLLDAEIGLQGGKILRSLLGDADAVPIRCAAAAIELRQGAGRLRLLVLDTARTRTVGTGTIDLRDETVDVVLTPVAKEGGLFVLDRSIRLHGPLRKPDRELVARSDSGAASRGACPP